MTALLLVHLAAAWFMTGLIWVIQLVHYPLFLHVGRLDAAAYQQYQFSHMRRISWIVGPVMLVELATAGLLLAYRPEGVSAALMWVNLALLGLIWLSTATLQGPCHHRLSRGFEPDHVRRLVRSNWLRTVLWTTRAILLLFAVPS